MSHAVVEFTQSSPRSVVGCLEWHSRHSYTAALLPGTLDVAVSPTSASEFTDPAAAPIAFVDLASQHAEIADEFANGLRELLAKTSFVCGPAVEAFERAYA